MKITRELLLFLKDEIINSMKNNGARESTSDALKHLVLGNVSAKFAERRITYNIRMGYSKFKSLDKIKELYGVKKYYADNKDEYGDIYESEILNTFYQ